MAEMLLHETAITFCGSLSAAQQKTAAPGDPR